MDYTFVEGTLDAVLEQFNKYSVVGLDLETSGLNPIDSRILLCQLAFEGGDCFVIDARKVDLTPLLPYMESKKWVKIIHQAKFESKFFLHYYNTKILGVFDTLLAEKVLIPGGKRNGLDDVALKYTGVVLDKSIRKSFLTMRPMQAFTEEQLGYAAKDSYIMFDIRNQQMKLLEEAGLTQVAQLEFDVAPVVAEMELAGIPIMQEKWRKIIRDYQNKFDASSQKIFSLIFDEHDMPEQVGMFERQPMNLRSPKQLLETLQKIGIDITTTGETELSKVDHPAAKELINWRGYQKIVDTYGLSLLEKIHPFTGRLHPDFDQAGTETGRFSCREPNVQQIPEELRACVGDPNYSLIICDYSQIELRVLAEMSQDPNLIKAFNSGEDCHKATASLMFKLPIDQITKAQRYTAKTIGFGIIYGMGARKLMDTLNEQASTSKDKITITRARELVAMYKYTYNVAIRWLEGQGNKALRTGSVESLFGRKRYFNRPKFIDQESFDKQVGAIKRAGANSPVQGSSADITKLALIAVYEELHNYFGGAHIILQVHDEIVVISPKNQAEEIKKIMVDAMVSTAETLIKSVPITVSSDIGDYWEKR